MDVRRTLFMELVLLAVVVTATTAHAQRVPAEPPEVKEPAAASAGARGTLRTLERPHTIAEFEAGVIALPTAPISPGRIGGDTPLLKNIVRGDATLQTGLHVLYRWSRDYAIGAGALFAPSPTSDSDYDNRGGLRRAHSRSYLFFGIEGRYSPLVNERFEVWLGLSSGAVIVADRFSTDGEDIPGILGKRELTIRTEGLAVGAQLGANYNISERVFVGSTFRGYHWILPGDPRCSPIGDCATLSGAVHAFELGLKFGYRVPL